MNNTSGLPTNESSGEMEPLIYDRILRCFYGSCFLVGVPLNVVAFGLVLSRYRAFPHKKLLLLHLHLNASDFGLLCFFCLGRTFWLTTYVWEGGEGLCRLMRFLEAFAFSLSSNIIVCVALERVYAVRKPFRSCAGMSRRLQWMLGTGWAAAAAVAAPQLAFFRLFELSPGVSQCASVWQIRSYVNEQDQLNRGVPPDQIKLLPDPGTFFEWLTSAAAYQIYHLALTFWVPLGILIVSYAAILCSVNASLAGPSTASHRGSAASRLSVSTLLGRHRLSRDDSRPSHVTAKRKSGAPGLSRQATVESRRSAADENGRLPPLIETASQPDKSDPDLPPAELRRSTSQAPPASPPPRQPEVHRSAFRGIRRCSTLKRRGRSRHISFGSGAAALGGCEAEKEALRPRVRSLVLGGKDSVVLGALASKVSMVSVSPVGDGRGPPLRLRRSGGAHKLQRMRMKTLRTAVVLVLAYIVLWLPYNTLSAWDILFPRSYQRFEAQCQLLEGLVVLNAVVNPFIYGRFSLIIQACRHSRPAS